MLRKALAASVRAGLLPVLATALLAVSAGAAARQDAAPQYPNYPSETPAKFTPVNAGADFERREVMIPMRDGVKLHTVILIPKNLNGDHAKKAGILLTRTPYDADGMTTLAQSGHLESNLEGYDNAADVIVEDGYIRVVQDVRGKYHSEGDYVMNRPPHGPINPTPVDDATDTYDTIDWLVKHVPESNGKVGTLGISYDGFEPLMALIHPHPALKVSVPMNPMVDGWMGDDWFHHGAFRQQNLPYIYEQTASRGNTYKWWSNVHDDYDLYLRASSAGELAREHGMEQLPFWQKVLAHPAYDSFWQDQAVDRILAKEPLKVPVMLVHSLWDQEDIYGAIAVYKAIKPKDTTGTMVKLVMGPWHHGQEIGDGSSLGAIKFGSDTGRYFREHVLRPYLAQYLKNDAPKADVAPVTAFQTGSNRWENLDRWPAGCDRGCTIKPTPLYLGDGMKATFGKPTDTGGDSYVSDPAHPVPFRARPIQPVAYGEHDTWAQWLVDDQREASGRTDVLTYTSDVLTAPVTIAGQPQVHLTASTTGTDSDWVVKLIDVYPDEVAAQPEMGGYQLAVAMDILRGRYRQGFDKPEPITPDKPLPYTFALPTTNHVFLPGHRIMVQVQSSWFPLYDRNPQTFVPNIMLARPADYRKATQEVFHSSYVELPVVSGKGS
ncbi:CocE/NonD family hydrolase [Dyella ginsengisoli]|uniref:CocE/NonD family hydrolase n=1 Tax=Dyella ginsengisoli TaxID=363848 RepID=UPI0003470997